jgi:RES domain-containing protein
LSFELVAYRACGYETPLWAFPNLGDGRYNRAGNLPTQYLSLHPMTPWAELLRILDHRSADRARATRVEIWGLRISLAHDPTEVSFDTAGSYGVDAADLVADDYEQCQSLAEQLHADGVRSLIAPSAALPGTSNVVVMEPAVMTDYHLEPIDPEDWPTALLAQNGRCPENLWEHVHYRAAPVEHAALAAWRAGDEFTFVQPAVTTATLAVV